MTTQTLIIPLSFFLLAAIILWFVIGAKGKRWIKIVFISALPIFGFAVWRSLASYLGWPATEDPPDKFILLWAEIREPDAVYIWLVPYEEQENSSGGIMDYKPVSGEPRAYRLPYTREFHEQFQGAQRLIQKGRRVVFERKRKGNAAEEGTEEGRSGDQQRSGGGRDSENTYGGNSQRSQDYYRFYELPPPKPPQKTGP